MREFLAALLLCLVVTAVSVVAVPYRLPELPPVAKIKDRFISQAYPPRMVLASASPEVPVVLAPKPYPQIAPPLNVRHPRLKGVVAPLAAKVQQIVSSCGSKVISGVRNTYVAGTRRISLHASGRAVDVQGNPNCIYKQLAKWPGGYSTDYARVNHVHISYGGREHGSRFVHRGGGKTRYAKRHKRHHRYAQAYS